MVRKKEEEESAKNLAHRFDLPYISLAFKSVDASTLQIVPEEDAKEAGLAVVSRKGNSITVAVLDPQNLNFKEILQNLKGRFAEVSVYVTARVSIEKAWSGYKTKAQKKEKISGEV